MSGLRARFNRLLGPPPTAPIGLGYALRTTSAALASLAISHLLRIANPIWAVVSAVVVILPEVHASVKSAALRVTANAVGAGVGLTVGALAWPTPISLAVGLGAVAGLCRLMGIDAAARAASVAVVIVLLRDPRGVLGSSETRVLLVLLGCAVALAVTVAGAGIERALDVARRRPRA
jgi:uncharacterized membrane protein YgaE (UPF0421/DUF939 family)